RQIELARVQRLGEDVERRARAADRVVAVVVADARGDELVAKIAGDGDAHAARDVVRLDAEEGVRLHAVQPGLVTAAERDRAGARAGGRSWRGCAASLTRAGAAGGTRARR